MARSRSLLALLGAALVFTTAGAPGADKPKAPAATPAPATPEAKLIEGLSWREIGPFRGGRVTAVAGVAGPAARLLLRRHGRRRLEDDRRRRRAGRPSPTASSARARSARSRSRESDPERRLRRAWARRCIRGNVSHGDGVYKSTDAGKTWTHVGPRATRGRSARIRVHPQDPDLVYVAALGHAFGPNTERGVFRSKDGGKTWQKVLFVDDKTGAVDLAMDPANPRVLYAGDLAGAAHALEPRERRARAAGSTSRPTAATPGRSSTARACRRASGDASA